ncbi:MAG: alkaline phosphatase family protein [Acidobacteria bacterium]|nr:alkaline phosphatase family protein [Acidobacteriota bacterium]
MKTGHHRGALRSVRRWAALCTLFALCCQGAAQNSPRRRVFVLGIGSVRLAVIERLVRQGRMPSFARLLKEGALAPELLNVYPNKSHTPWISAASGAPAGAHGVFSMMKSDSGRPPYRQDLLGRLRQAEYLWEAAERQGKLPILLNWPDAWPSKLKRGTQIGGASLSVNGTFYAGEANAYRGPIHRFALGADEIFSTEAGEGLSPIQVVPAAESAARATGSGAGAAIRVELACRDSDREIARKPVLWLVAPESGGPLRVYAEGNWTKPAATVEIGRWTDRIDLQVETGGGPVAAAVRLKLLAFDAARRRAKLYATPVSAIRDGRVAPAGAAPELAGLKSFPIPTPVFLSAYSAQWLDPASQGELLAMNGDWHIDALRLLLRRPFDLFVFHDNDVDWAEHAVSVNVRNGVSREACERLVDDAYADLDRRVGAILAALPPKTTILVMSQHGIVSPWEVRPAPSVAAVLERAGLLVRAGDAIDYDKSVAFPAAEGGLIHVQPKNPASPEQRATRERNVEAALVALSSATEGAAKQRAFTVVLRWEDAAPFGIFGAPQADIIALRPAATGGIHGACWPLAAGGESTLKGFYLFWGPAARTGWREARPAWPEDLAPTAAHLLGIAPPADSSGAVLHRMIR